MSGACGQVSAAAPGPGTAGQRLRKADLLAFLPHGGVVGPGVSELCRLNAAVAAMTIATLTSMELMEECRRNGYPARSPQEHDQALEYVVMAMAALQSAATVLDQPALCKVDDLIEQLEEATALLGEVTDYSIDTITAAITIPDHPGALLA